MSQYPPPYKELEERDVANVERFPDDGTPPYEGSDEYPVDKNDDVNLYETSLEAEAEGSSSPRDLRDRGPKLDTVPIDTTKVFIPTRVFWVPFWNSFSKEIKIFDVSREMEGHWQGSVNKEYRELTKSLFDKHHKNSSMPCYVAVGVDNVLLRHHYSFRDSSGRELVDWKHGWYSGKEVVLGFSSDSQLSTQPVYIKRVTKHFSRNRVFQWNGSMYAIEMENSYRSNQITLFRLVDGKKYPVARYGMKFGGSWYVGGSMAINTDEIDEVIALLAVLVIIRQNKQRTHERNPGIGGGSGSG